MDEFLHHHRAPRYVALPHTIPNRILVDPSFSYPDFHPPSVLHHPIVSPYPPIANPTYDSSIFTLNQVSNSAGYVPLPLYGLHSASDVSRRDGVLESKRFVKNRVRFNNDDDRGNRDCAREFSRTPNKQVKRKSALLRIQTVKPKRRNREIEQLHCADYTVDSNTNSFRGKNKHKSLGYGYGKIAEEEEREGSPVEFDISFESNSLVAKTIVPPSSSTIVSNADMNPVSDKDLTPAGKKRRVLVSDSQLAELSKSAETSGSGKDLILQKNVSHTCSQPCSGGTHNPHGKDEVAQSSKGNVSDETANTCSRKISSRVVKKKRIVKKVVKKVVKPKSNRSKSNMLDGTVKADGVTLSSSTAPSSGKIKTLKDKSATVDKVSIPDCLQSLPGEGNLLPEEKRGDVPLLSLGTRSRSQDEGSDTGIERGGDIIKTPSGASSNVDKKTDLDCLDANNSAHSLLRTPNTDKITKSLNGSTSEIDHKDDVNKRSCQTEVSLSPVEYSNVGCPQHEYHAGDEMNCRLLSSTENVINTYLPTIHNFASGRVADLSSNDKLKENTAVSDIGNDDIVGKAYCESKATTLSQDAISEENPDTAIPIPSRGMLGSSSSAKAMIQNGLDCLQHATLLRPGSDNGLTNSEDCITFLHGGIMNDTGKQGIPSNVAVSPENCDTQSLPNSDISVGYGDGYKLNKREVQTQLNFLHPLDLENSVRILNVEDSNINMLLKDHSPSEIVDQSVQRLDFNSQSSLDGVTTSHLKRGLLEAKLYFGKIGNGDANNVSPKSKRKKVNSCHPNVSQCPSELSDAIVATTSCAEVPISFSDKQEHQEEVALLSMAFLSGAPSVSYPEDIAKLPDNNIVRESFESVDVNRERVSSEHSELQHSGVAPHYLFENSVTPNFQFPIVEGEQKENATLILPLSNTETGIVVVGNITGEKTSSQDTEENHPNRDFMKRSPNADMESNNLNMKGDLLPLQNSMCCPFDGYRVSSSNSKEASIKTLPNALLPDLDCLAMQNESTFGDSRSMIEQGSDLFALTSSAQHTGKIMKSDDATIMPPPSQVYSEVKTQSLKSYRSELNGSKNEPGCVLSETSKGQSFIFSKPKTPASSTHMSKSRTWHRVGNNAPTSLPGSKPSVRTVPPKKPVLENKGNTQNTSYIRKGNSLIRKPIPVSALSQISNANQWPSLGLDEFQKSIRSESKVDVADQQNILKAGVTNVPLRGKRTPPLPIDPKSEENRSSPLILTHSIGCCEKNATDPRSVIETNDAPNSSEDVLKYSGTLENQIGPSNNGESQVEVNDGNMSSLNAKRFVYIKPKSNQLLATSNVCDLSVATDDKAQTACSNGYYKRRKNQLVRTSFGSHISHTVAIPNSNVNSDGLGACNILLNRRLSKRRLHKVAGSLCIPLKDSLVWTLGGKNTLKNDTDLRNYQKLLPQLFPWKRSTFIRSFIHNNPASSSISRSISAKSKKLLLLRKRDTVYTRSTNGFSLWKSKVLGVGESSLKWSKSIERHSRKVNEEATVAVAALERKKREQKDVACSSSHAKRERIFRIGSVRYRMDPSRRTLQRISDDESLLSGSICSGVAAKQGYIPRRLLLGKDEYVRIGDGNQLIRNPKKWSRILANEKVRWSLHTARQRLARKHKYCQFFTRFGQCNKDDGKCPYIHDPSKIAVCSKFLNGFCSSLSCKLTHKVIPERMPDCSYFMQGLCTNRDCPYRHVSVNPKASICEEFLKGYCADGNECRKKHSYVCPTFEAIGNCNQGAKCKLHHPKKQGKGKKRKRSGDQNNSRGRYFGSLPPTDIFEPGMMLAQRQWQQSNDNEGEISDYISLEVDEEVTEGGDQSYEQATSCDSGPLDNLDELIRPALLMKKNFMVQSSSVQ